MAPTRNVFILFMTISLNSEGEEVHAEDAEHNSAQLCEDLGVLCGSKSNFEPSYLISLPNSVLKHHSSARIVRTPKTVGISLPLVA